MFEAYGIRDPRGPTGLPVELLLDEFLLQSMWAALADLDARAQKPGPDAEVERAFVEVMRLRGLRRALEDLPREDPGDRGTAVYLVSTDLLLNAYRVLTRTRNEHLVYATGPEDGKRLFALTRLVHFKLIDQSVAHAAPEPASQTAALLELDQRDERLLAVMHSHPGRGPRSTVPSADDMATQSGLERMGYPAIGAVFSRDGFVRFFSANRRFRVEVSGAGKRHIEDSLFRLTGAPQGILVRKGGTHDETRTAPDEG